ncbi:hypothetical protein PFICI_02319 [Pestalotiopsis fici W106-1]|uniref:NACHT domain-containing protein n=1 Tax=Pestalotiopsis fici (strain W106-1 / CGMCC3.15140) TaxID=1229662 RepID=W3XE62_PESFW|nr:uncharacterized protein PFICI_02319 [Pestalotiopsis fici W106-1]ETS84294.1 hypothetical protein PFICI_02319 [Pestalotiopsis fici W106-1]
MEHTPISLLVLGLVSVLSYIWFRQVLKRPRQTSLNACDRRPEEELEKPDKQTPWQDEASQLGHESPAEEASTTVASSHARSPLEILYPGQSDKSIEVDIVAVHGLGANVDWSWIHKDGPREINWLRDSDMLPAQVPQARIIAYNYESKWHSDAPKTRLRLCGEDLIVSLDVFRADCRDRPLMFIGHSLGGNVIQHGLLYADRESDYRSVIEATTGLIFLGTPFRGSKMQPLAVFAAALMTPMGSHSGIVKNLGYDDVDLHDNLHDFCRLCNRLSLTSCCFFELDSTDYGRKAGISGIIKGMCVEEASACITGHDRFSLQTDHFKLNKFAGPGDRSFLLVSSKIKKLADNAAGIVDRRRNPLEIVTSNDYAHTKKPEARNCLRDLFLSDPAEDKQRLKRKKGKRAANTCEWVLSTEELTAWLGTGTEPTSRFNVLWLYGNPGTGKSTMALYLADELANVFTRTNGKTLAYFFCDSSIEERKTATAVVRGLLLQLVQQHPQLLDDILPKYDERGANVFTSFDAVWSMFIKAAADKKTGVKFCIIDALDECDAASQKTLLQQLEETFKDPESVRNVSFLITSRPYPEIREPLEQFATNADLAAFPQVTKDIERCIAENVATLEKRKYYTKAVTEQVKKILRDKAQGTFLWIGLACKELTDVDSKDAVQCLQDLPQGLPALYESLLERAMQRPHADKRIIQQILSFVTIARRPLEILELANACGIYQDEDRETRSQFTQEAVRSCGLLIVVQDNRLYLLHKSVTDFLIQSRDYIQFDELHSHAALAYRCIDYLIEQHENERRANPRETELESYAVAFWPEHVRLAGSVFKILARQTVFFTVDSEVRDSWRRAWNSRQNSWKEIPDQSSLAHVAARLGLVPLIEYMCDQGIHDGPVDWDSSDSSGRSPLELSAEAGDVSSMSLLLQKGARVSHRVLVAAAGIPLNGPAMLELLLDSQRDQVVVTEGIVQAAARNPYNGEEIIKLLLDRRGNQVIVTEGIVQAAAGNPYNGEETIKLLLDRRGNQVVVTEGILQAAARNGRSGEAVMKLLVNARGGHECNILQVASSQGYREIVQLLLENKVDVNAQGGHHGNALQAASAIGDEEIVKMLVDHGADVNASHNAATPLLTAAKKGHEEVVCILLAAGADYRVTNNFARSALMYAAIHNLPRAVDVLLGKPGLDINAKDYWGGTAISFAARLGHSEIFQKLATLSNIDLQAKDCFDRTSLWWAQRQGHMNIANALIDWRICEIPK